LSPLCGAALRFWQVSQARALSIHTFVAEMTHTSSCLINACTSLRSSCQSSIGRLIFICKKKTYCGIDSETDQDPNSPQSRLSIQIESAGILRNHRNALAVIEDHLHLAGDTTIVEASLRYVRHVKVFEMLREAGLKDDPVSHGEPYPHDYFPLIEKRVNALQTEYDQLILRLRPAERD
jgi:hypothetical protein